MIFPHTPDGLPEPVPSCTSGSDDCAGVTAAQPWQLLQPETLRFENHGSLRSSNTAANSTMPRVANVCQSIRNS
jgi:hypothetical protein